MPEAIATRSLPGFLNARDLGGHRAGSSVTRSRVVVRAEAPTRMTEDDQRLLLERGVGGFLDLRTDREAVDEPSPFRDHPGYLRVGILDDLALRGEVRRLTDSDALLAYLVHDRAAGVASAMRGLLELSETGTVLVHCRAGKDRTGVVAALLLWNAGVADDAIARDHALSGPNMEALYAIWAAASPGPIDPDSTLNSGRRFPPTAASMQRTLTRLASRHGSAAGYLRWAGLGDGEIVGLRSMLVPGSGVE